MNTIRVIAITDILMHVMTINTGIDRNIINANTIDTFLSDVLNGKGILTFSDISYQISKIFNNINDEIKNTKQFVFIILLLQIILISTWVLFPKIMKHSYFNRASKERRTTEDTDEKKIIEAEERINELNKSQSSTKKLLRISSKLIKDANGIINLPDGFKYKIISQFGDKMSDGLQVPNHADGMGCFKINSC